MRFPDALFITAFMLVFYGVGASFVEAFVNYPTWPLIGEADFKRYHQAISRRVIAVVVAPFAVSLILTAGLLEWRPPAIPAWSVWVSLTLFVIVAVVSVVLQIPIQRQFDTSGWSSPLLAKLNRQEWLRKAPLVGNAALFLWMMARILATHPAAGGAGS